MKLEDIILVTENRKGVETKYLFSFQDYFELLLEIQMRDNLNLSHAIECLFRTKEDKGNIETYVSANKTFFAKFCASESELRCFLLGFKDNEKDKAEFNEDKCSTECLEVLKTYGLQPDGNSLFNSLHYKQQDYDFKVGEVLHNMNGNNYFVLAVLSKKNLLLLSQSDKQYILANNTIMYERTPKQGVVSEDSVVRGIEWGHGSYLGYDLANINLPGIFQEYGKPYEINTIEDYRCEARRQFNVYQWLAKEEGIAFAVQWAAEESMRKEFGTTNRNDFEDSLQEGRYDQRLQSHQAKREEKLR